LQNGLANVGEFGESEQNRLANVGEFGESEQNRLANVGEFGKSGTFPKKAILASTQIRQKWRISGECSNLLNSLASGHCLRKTNVSLAALFLLFFRMLLFHNIFERLKNFFLY
jgi:hypothetical protein